MGPGSSVVMVVIEDVVGKAHDVVAMVIDDVVVTVHDDVGTESGTENTLLGVGGVKVCTAV